MKAGRCPRCERVYFSIDIKVGRKVKCPHCGAQYKFKKKLKLSVSQAEKEAKKRGREVPMEIMYAASECFPFVKSGGLGDAVFSLGQAIKNRDINSSVVIPKYEEIFLHFQNKMTEVDSFIVPVGWREKKCQVEKISYEGIDFYFISNKHYFERQGLYGHLDDAERFTFFSRAVLEMIYHFDLSPDIIHCHDWQTAPISILLNTVYKNDPFYAKLATVFTFHNINYQGIFPKEVLSDILGLNKKYFTPEKLEYFGQINFLKGAVKYADTLVAPSREYARKVKQPEFGKELSSLFSRREEDLYGIVQGVDKKEYNPASDSYIFQNYQRRYADLDKKHSNKIKLQQSLGLPPDRDIPLLVMVSNLEAHKGIDLLLEAIPPLLEEESLQIIILGRGQNEYEQSLKYIGWQNPDKFSANITFNENLARKIYAGGDFYLQPSRSVPCGMSPLIALRYLTVPIIRDVGGLCEEIEEFNEDNPDGFGFVFETFEARKFYQKIKEALRCYQDKKCWSKLIENACSYSYDWQDAADKHLEVYKKTLNKG